MSVNDALPGLPIVCPLHMAVPVLSDSRLKSYTEDAFQDSSDDPCCVAAEVQRVGISPGFSEIFCFVWSYMRDSATAQHSEIPAVDSAGWQPGP